MINFRFETELLSPPGGTVPERYRIKNFRNIPLSIPFRMAGMQGPRSENPIASEVFPDMGAITRSRTGQRRIVHKLAPVAFALAATALLIITWSMIALSGCPDFLYNGEALYKGWIAKALLNRMISDPFSIQYSLREGGSVLFALSLVPIFHLMGDSLFHLAFGSILWQAAIMASLVVLCWRIWGPMAAFWAGLLLLCAPMPYLQRSMNALANHCEVPLFGLLNALLLLRIFRNLKGRDNTPLWSWVILGAINGLGLYFSYEHLCVVVADLLILSFLFAKTRLRPARMVEAIVLTVVGLGVGLSPWLYYFLRWYSFGGNEIFHVSDVPLWSLFGVDDPIVKLRQLWDFLKVAGGIIYPHDTNQGILGKILPFISRAVFAIFPVAAIAGFVAITLAGILRGRLSSTKWIQAWLVVFLLVHLAAFWAYEHDTRIEYLLPLYPILCVMGGATFGRKVGGRSAFKWIVRTLKALFGLSILSLAFLQSPIIGSTKTCIETTLKYKGYSDRPRPSLFTDPVSSVHEECRRLEWTSPQNLGISHWHSKFFFPFSPSATVDRFMEGWNLLVSEELEMDDKLERSLPVLAFNLGEIAVQEGLDIEEVRTRLDQAIPDRYRHFLYMGYSYFLRLGGIEETDRVLRSIEKVDARYRHYFFLAHGACLGLRYKSDPTRIDRFLDAWSGDNLSYMIAGILWAIPFEDRILHPLSKTLPNPARIEMVCRKIGPCTSDLKIGKEAIMMHPSTISIPD